MKDPPEHTMLAVVLQYIPIVANQKLLRRAPLFMWIALQGICFPDFKDNENKA